MKISCLQSRGVGWSVPSSQVEFGHNSVCASTQWKFGPIRSEWSLHQWAVKGDDGQCERQTCIQSEACQWWPLHSHSLHSRSLRLRSALTLSTLTLSFLTLSVLTLSTLTRSAFTLATLTLSTLTHSVLMLSTLALSAFTLSAFTLSALPTW